VPPVDGHNTTGQFIPSLHGFNGEVSVSPPGFNLTSDTRAMATTGQLSEFPYNEDTSGGDDSLLGISFIQSSIGKGVRSSSSTSYLANANTRPNLTVLINATVVTLEKTDTKGALKSFRSVQFRSSHGMQFFNFRILHNTLPMRFRPNDREGAQRSHPICWDDWNNTNTSIVWNRMRK
jgi:GMC oxidoreductase